VLKDLSDDRRPGRRRFAASPNQSDALNVDIEVRSAVVEVLSAMVSLQVLP
jgi:hypothetical protein